MPGRKLRQRGSNKLHLMHLGAAGWEITDGERVILLDPYLSRLRITGQFGTYTTPSLPGDTRRIFGPEDDLVGTRPPSTRTSRGRTSSCTRTRTLTTR